MSEPWRAIAEGVVGVVEGRLGRFLEDNAGAREFIEERSRRLGELLLAYSRAGSREEREGLLRRLELVRSTLEAELAALALRGSREVQSLFRTLVGDAFSLLIRVSPSMMSRPEG